MSGSVSAVCARGGCAVNTDLKTCGGCQSVKYCSEECQKTAYTTHKATCEKLANDVCNGIVGRIKKTTEELRVSQGTTKQMTFENKGRWGLLEPEVNACLQSEIITRDQMVDVRQRLQVVIDSGITALTRAKTEVASVTELAGLSKVPLKASPTKLVGTKSILKQLGTFVKPYDGIMMSIREDLEKARQIAQQLDERLQLVDAALNGAQ